MMQTLIDFVFAIDWRTAFPVITAFGGAWLTSRLSRRGTFMTRLWELRREAYGEVLGTLREARVASLAIVARLQTMDDFTEVTPQFQELLTKFIDHNGALRGRIARDGIILSEAFHKLHDAHVAKWDAISASSEANRVKAKAFADNLADFEQEVAKLARTELSSP